MITIVRLAAVAYDQGTAGVDEVEENGSVPTELAELARGVLAAT
ncbi:MAG: hypothetical protein ACJAYX_004369 [Planctomycetota bacterium]